MADKPTGSLGRMEDVAAWLALGGAGAARRSTARWWRSLPATTASLTQGVSPRPMSATAAAVELCAAGGAAINQICLAHDLGLKVFDLALHLPTGDITREAALDERGCAATMAFGMEAIAGGTDLLCLGDLGVGDSTVAAAISAMLLWRQGCRLGRPRLWRGRAMIAAQGAAVDAAMALHRGHAGDPLEILRRVGGREFAAIAGAIIAARAEKIPVILDGFAATAAAAAVLHAMNPAALDALPAGAAADRARPRARCRKARAAAAARSRLSHGEGVGCGACGRPGQGRRAGQLGHGRGRPAD